MFPNAKVLQFLISGFMAALLLVAMGCDQDNNSNPKGATNAATNQGAPTTGNPLESVANAAEPPTPPAEATPTITEEEAQAQEAAKARAIAARKKAQEAAKDPCRKLVCSTDDEPWRGCYYAAALYRDAPGTVPGVRHVVSILRPDQLEWYNAALLASYRHDLWYSADYRMGDAADLNQSARDVRVGILGDKDTESMSEGVVCGLLGSTEITLADVLAASRANSPFVAKKKEKKEESLYLRDPFEPSAPATLPAEPAAPTTEPSCGADPCPPPSDAPATPDCGGATPCPSPSSGVGPAPDPAATTPAAPAFDPAAVPPATDPVPAEPPADAPAMDPAAPSDPGGVAPPAPTGNGEVTFFRGTRGHHVRL